MKLISSDEESNNAAVEEIKKVAGRLDVVVANAGQLFLFLLLFGGQFSRALIP